MINDINTAPSKVNFQIFRFRKIPFGIISSPFLLSSTIHYHFVNTNSDFANKILPDSYVDNLISGVATFNDGKILYTEAKNIFMNASMNLRQWKSNSGDLNSLFTAKNYKLPNEDVSVLGSNWNTTTNTPYDKNSYKK